MQGMADLGWFGDERLKKGEPSCCRLSWLNVRRVYVGWAATVRGRYGLAVSCTIER